MRSQAPDPPPERSLRPADVCRQLLIAMEASEGRRRRRKRDTTPDAIGLGIKRALLEAIVAEDPTPETFEAWLLERSLSRDPLGGGSSQTASGPVRAMALDILAEWRLAVAAGSFQDWLRGGARSDDC